MPGDERGWRATDAICPTCGTDTTMNTSRLREALHTIMCNTEPDAIKHRDYEHLAKDIYDCARAALALPLPPTNGANNEG